MRLTNCFALAALPALLATIGCASLSGISPFAYPHWWDYTKARPADSDLAGTYTILKLSGSPPGFDAEHGIRIVLRSDHTAEVAGIAEFDPFGKSLACTFSGKGTWSLTGESMEWWLYFRPEKTAKSECADGGHAFLLLGRHSPYRLYQIVGDPDSDVGIEFKRD